MSPRVQTSVEAAPDASGSKGASGDRAPARPAGREAVRRALRQLGTLRNAWNGRVPGRTPNP